MGYVYNVIAEFDDPCVAAEWLEWLQDGHMQAVLEAGAATAEVLKLEPIDVMPLRLEVRYSFADKAAFEFYERTAAPSLRADGLARFPQDRGVRLRRIQGVILAELPRRQSDNCHKTSTIQ